MSHAIFGDVTTTSDTVAATNNETFEYHVAASTSNHKTNSMTDMEVKWKDVPDKYFIIIAHFLAGRINDTEVMNHYNGPILISSIESVFWIFLIQYAILAILGVIMNVLIIAYVMYHRLYKDVTHAFIINLALCHFVQCALVLPITLMVMLIQNWIFGQFLCFFLPMLQDIPLHVAIISHILIAWDRMRWLGDPLKGRLPAFVCCCATWLTGMVIALPYPIYTIYVEIGDYVPGLDGMGLCVVNLMDDMHEYMRGLFLIMYCAPTVLLAYLYIRTSQELRPPDGPFATIKFEHNADLRNRQRNSSASSVDRASSNVITSGNLVTIHASNGTTNNNTCIGGGGGGGVGGGGLGYTGTTMTTAPTVTKSISRSYDLYSAELDVYREKRKQRNFGSMAAAQIVCLCPLMVLRFARLSIEETYENQKHFDFTYLMFVWIAFLPTVIFPCIYASQILPRTEQERLRGYFRLSSKRLHKAPRSRGGCRDGTRDNEAGGGGGGGGVGGCDGAADSNGHSSSSREDSIEKDEHTNTTEGTAIITNGDEYLTGVATKATKHNMKMGAKYQHHNNCPSMTQRQSVGRTATTAYGGGGSANTTTTKHISKDVRGKKNDIKINIISDGKSKQTTKVSSSATLKNGNLNSENTVGGTEITYSGAGQRKLTRESLDNNSCSNLTSSTYCNGNSSLLDDGGGISNFGDGEDSSIVSGMIVHNNGNSAAYYEKKWLHQKDLSFSDCSSFPRMDSSSTLERDMEIIDLLERERSMDIQEMMEREKHGETIRLTAGGERRRLPDIDKIYPRSPKPTLDPYSFEQPLTGAVNGIASATSSSTMTTSDGTRTRSTSLHSTNSDPLHCHNEKSYSSVSSTLTNSYANNDGDGHDDDETTRTTHLLSQDNDVVMEEEEEEVPQDFFDNYPPGGDTNMPPAANTSATTAATTTPPYQYQYTRRLSRKSSHHSQGSNSHRMASKRDSFNSLNGSDLIAGAFGELDPTQPLSKMSVIENRMRRSSGRTSSFSSSGRSSMKSRDFNHGSTHSTHPDLDFRENIFAEL